MVQLIEVHRLIGFLFLAPNREHFDTTSPPGAPLVPAVAWPLRPLEPISTSRPSMVADRQMSVRSVRHAWVMLGQVMLGYAWVLGDVLSPSVVWLVHDRVCYALFIFVHRVWQLFQPMPFLTQPTTYQIDSTQSSGPASGPVAGPLLLLLLWPF